MKKFTLRLAFTTLLIIGLFVGANNVWAASEESSIGVSYRGHVQNYGNMPKPEGSMITGPNPIGTRNLGLRVEGFWIELTGDVPEDAKIIYQVHVQNVGWMEPVENGAFAGTEGMGYRVESIRIWLDNLPGYDVYYRGHVQNVGNLPLENGSWQWVKNGMELGTTGSGLRLEELQVKIIKLGQQDEIDLSAYDEILATIAKLSAEDYTTASWQVLQSAVIQNSVTANNTQEEINAAVMAIQNAYTALEIIPPDQETTFEDQVLALVNVEREKAGLSPLSGDVMLNQAATIRSNELIDLFSHTRPDQRSCFTVLDDLGIDYSWAGENIAAGYSSPEAVVNGWMNSPGHRANILSENFTKLGVGYVLTDKGYRHYWTQLFIS